MQRSASPDITEGVPPLPERKTARPVPRKTTPGTVTGNNPAVTSTPSLSEGDNTQILVKRGGRGRGRPKRVYAEPSKITGPVPQSNTSPLGSSPNQVQHPKRRGRKPRASKENEEVPVGPLPESDPPIASTVSDELAMDITPDAAHNLTFQMNKLLGGIDSSDAPMETEEVSQPVAVPTLFSSVMTSDPFGQRTSGGGIPGLDLEDSDANSSIFSTAGPAPTLEPVKVHSFLFASNIGRTIVEDECRGIQQLQISSQKEILKPSVVEGQTRSGIKKDEPVTTEDSDSSKVRRSSRIKTLEEQRGTRGRRREVVSSLSDSSGLSRSNISLLEDDSNSNSSSCFQTSSGYSSPSRDGSVGGNGMSSSSSVPNLSSFSTTANNGSKPLKVKSRWRYSLDAESMKTFSMAGDVGAPPNASMSYHAPFLPENLEKRSGHLIFDGSDQELLGKLRKFAGIDESEYLTGRKISKENRGMVCDCYVSEDPGEIGCGEDCLNRLLMVECGNKCPTGEKCSNRRFQRKEYATLEVFKTEKKGHGLRTLQCIPEGGFVIEYVGEVLDVPEFERRTTNYAKGNQEHFYFMALKSDAIIDATMRGNCSRFINHSCEPNCETQKWTVNGEVRIGFFAIADLQPGDEITFDYQFQRYGKKAQKCYCMTESCRGWIGEEEDETEADAVEDKEETVQETGVEVEDSKVKTKPKVERKKRKNIQLEDMAFREELAKLESSGLKNRNHTLTLSRLMVRAESWDDRERILKVLLNGDTPCRRLFLDYHGLRLIWSWMIDLPLPQETTGPQLIRNDVYHKLFLQTLQSLPIPHKTMLLESKLLTLVEKWCMVPSVTTSISISLIKRSDSTSPGVSDDIRQAEENSSNVEVVIKVENDGEKMDTDLTPQIDIKEEPTSSTAEGIQEIVEEKAWDFVNMSKTLWESWTDLKEVFRIPKKERLEQMKEHEREADKAQQSSTLTNVSSTSSYDRDHRNKQYRSRGERRVPVLDPTQQQPHFRYPSRMVIPPGVSKEEWRKHFEQTVRQKEEQEMLRKQQDALVTLHQERCALVGLDPATTPIVDPHGVHYLDPKTVMWRAINIDDPAMPPELIKFVQLSQYPPPVSEIADLPTAVPVEPEQAFPPWPSGLPPPPPLPPTELPKHWKMAVDDEGRCYYYHIRTKVTRWDPPPEDISTSESSDSSSDEEVVEEGTDEGSPSITKSKVLTWKSRHTRAEKRKKSGLVQERIISPRGDDDKGFSKEMVKENKRKAQEEKLARIARKEKAAALKTDNPKDDEELITEELPSNEAAPEETREPVIVKPKKSSSAMKKRRKERQSRKPPQTQAKTKPKPEVDESEENPESSSPIETELDLTLSQLDDETGFFSKVSAGPSRIIGSTPSMDVVMIPGLGFDSRDLDAKKKADRAARHAAKKKAHALQKKAKEKAPETAPATVDKRLSSKEASTFKDAFKNSVSSVVVAHLNPYLRTEHIKSNDDFKHLARKITHVILLKELKHTRDVTSLEVTDSVKHKTKEYIKKFMARFPHGVYVRSPENQQSQ